MSQKYAEIKVYGLYLKRPKGSTMECKSRGNWGQNLERPSHINDGIWNMQ